ncbi:unnamed protein product [Phytophthora fragariaefolia]|uniref:Unnamed protein product n=1 Tax=Phytophthora fragariaefolia TaxID=1490495 RepID=A0A9W6Y7X2_9STRA|nr:unnamed protein product [Phytophthora fragariaefolia]
MTSDPAASNNAAKRDVHCDVALLNDHFGSLPSESIRHHGVATMMFWGLGGGAKAATPAATAHASAHRRSSQVEQLAAVPAVPVTPSYVLSEQRRSELLLAARTNRVSWVDGADERRLQPLPAATADFPGSLAASAIPSHCRDALEGVGQQFSSFVASLDELKRRILANDLQLTEEATQGEESSAGRYCTLFQELRQQEALLDQWQRTHSPRARKLTRHDREMRFLTGFRELVALLKNAHAAELVYRIQSFVKRAELWDLPQMLRATPTKDRPGGRIQDFVKKLVEQIKHSSKLRRLLQGDDQEDGALAHKRFLHVQDEYGVDLLHEVLEAFLMEKLYTKTLTPSEEAARQDEALHERLSLLGFVTFKHLDLPVPKTEEQEQTWLRLAKQLEAMTLSPSPRRKMDGVLRVCQDLTTFLKSQNGNVFPSADDFLPALIYIVLRANPSELKRNVAYILEYRNPSKLVSEPGYFFTHLVSSVAFLEEVNGSLLTISAEEFDEGLRRSKEILRQRGVRRELDHEVASNASSSSANGETLNDTVKLIQSERRKQTNPNHEDCNKEESLRLPTVLEIRAKRLATRASDLREVLELRKKILEPEPVLSYCTTFVMISTWFLSGSSREKSKFSIRTETPPRRVHSKNCSNNKKLLQSIKRRKIKEELEETRRLQEQIHELDRRLTLFNARALVCRQNAGEAAMRIMETYYSYMARGYDRLGDPQQAIVTRKFLLATFDEGLKTPDFTGIENLMKQWELISTCHKSVCCRLDGLELVDHYDRLPSGNGEEKGVHVVKTHGVITLEISRATFESVFPHIMADEVLAQSLMGKRYSFSFTLIAYVSASSGRIFQLESKIDLTSALMNLLQDPFAAVQMVNSTTMNMRGNLLLSEDIREDQNVIENGCL